MNRVFLRLLFCFLMLLSIPAFSQISFSKVDLNNKNEILFTLNSSVSGKLDYETLFKKKLDSNEIEQLTFYPELIRSLSSGSILEIRNRFGTARYNTQKNEFSWVNIVNPFIYGGIPILGHLDTIASSPDGKWVVYIEKITAAKGKLCVHDVQQNQTIVLSENVDCGQIPVSWAPDASILLYSIDQSIYFVRPESLFSKNLVDQKFRRLGSGGINAINWNSNNSFYYVVKNSVYRVQTQELITRSLYAPLIQVGNFVGKLPNEFNSFLDSFSVSKDGASLLYAQGKRNIFLCPLKGDDYVSTAKENIPYFLLPGSTSAIHFFWTDFGIPLFITESIENGNKNIKAWCLDSSKKEEFVRLDLPKNTIDYCVSPNGAMIACNTNSGLIVFSTKTWNEIGKISDEKIIAFDWLNNTNLFLGGHISIRQWNVLNNDSSILLLSNAQNFSWDEQEESVVLDAQGFGRFEYKENMLWNLTPTKKIRPRTHLNPTWRMYIDTGSSYFENMLFARSALSPGGTFPVIKEPDITYAHVSDTKEIRNIAVVFDAMDGIEGLAEILFCLDLFKIKASFFINGEFIRQHPEAVNEIVKAGHQTGSLFFTTWDLTDNDYTIDEDFIIRGLSRNEDDFFNVTGKELSLIWHAPYYYDSPIISNAGKKSGYRYVTNDVIVSDWLTKEQDALTQGLYMSTSEIIDHIIKETKSGSIIPIRIGKSDGTRNDYLFDRIQILLNALIENGYNITTVDELLK